MFNRGRRACNLKGNVRRMHYLSRTALHQQWQRGLLGYLVWPGRQAFGYAKIGSEYAGQSDFITQTQGTGSSRYSRGLAFLTSIASAAWVVTVQVETQA